MGTALFQIFNTLLWILMGYAIYRLIKHSKKWRLEIEKRLSQLEER